MKIKFLTFLFFWALYGTNIFSQRIEEKINNFFISKLLIPYSFPEFNDYKINAKIKGYTITLNDSLVYKFIPDKKNRGVLLQTNVEVVLIKTKGLQYYLTNNNLIFNLKKNRDIYYKLIDNYPYKWVNYNNYEEVIIKTPDELLIKIFKLKKIVFKSSVLYQDNKIKKIIISKGNNNIYNFKNDTIIIEKVFRNYNLTYKNIYFFDKKGKIKRIRTIKYVKLLDESDVQVLLYSYDKINGEFVPEILERIFKYTYDENGNITSKTELENGIIINKMTINYNFNNVSHKSTNSRHQTKPPQKN